MLHLYSMQKLQNFKDLISQCMVLYLYIFCNTDSLEVFYKAAVITLIGHN